MPVTFAVCDVAIAPFAPTNQLDAGHALLELTSPPDGLQPLPDGTPLDRTQHVVTLWDEEEGEAEQFREAMRTARHIGGRPSDVEVTNVSSRHAARAHLADTRDGLVVSSVEGEVLVRIRERTWPKGASPHTPSNVPVVLTSGSTLTIGNWEMTVKGALPTRAPTIEASGSSLGDASAGIVPAHNGLVDALFTSFQAHVPLALSPDHVWLAIVQAFAIHVRLNAEAVRDRFVPFQGKQHIVVRRNQSFAPGNPNNDWNGVVDDLTRLLGEHLGAARTRLVVGNFSTTTNVERMASSIALLDAMSPFFTYELMTLCGIPRITLRGTAADWRDVHTRARALSEFVDGWWSELGPALENFVNAASGNVDVEVWRSIYKYQSESGGAHVNGWINALFPYIEPQAGVFVRRDPRYGDTVKHGQHPWSISSANLVWSLFGEETLPMRLVSGMPGMAMVDDALQPVVAWAILRDG